MLARSCKQNLKTNKNMVEEDAIGIDKEVEGDGEEKEIQIWWQVKESRNLGRKISLETN